MIFQQKVKTFFFLGMTFIASKSSIKTGIDININQERRKLDSGEIRQEIMKKRKMMIFITAEKVTSPILKNLLRTKLALRQKLVQFS